MSQSLRRRMFNPKMVMLLAGRHVTVAMTRFWAIAVPVTRLSFLFFEGSFLEMQELLDAFKQHK